MLLFPDEEMARREGGYFCPADMPRPGEKVYVVGGENQPKRSAKVISSQSATQQTLYGGSSEVKGALLQPTPGFEGDCSVSVQFDDGTTGIVSAAVQPTPLWQKTLDQLTCGAGLAMYGWLIFSPSGTAMFDNARGRHEELKRELKEMGRPPTDSLPPSGEYWGSSEESDEGDQAVRSTLKFGKNGSITGRGVDGVDGAYRISDGRWGVRDGVVTLAWIEVYDEGFKVVVSARYRASTGKISGRFTSSRGVMGSFDLAPKPSIF